MQLVRSLLFGVCLSLQIDAMAADSSPGGQQQFQQHCAGCHGADAQGGEHGPDLVNTRHARSQTAEGLRAIIQNGIVSGGMPAFHLSDDDLRQVTSFLVRLTAPAMSAFASGDIQAGEHFFVTKTNIRKEKNRKERKRQDD